MAFNRQTEATEIYRKDVFDHKLKKIIDYIRKLKLIQEYFNSFCRFDLVIDPMQSKVLIYSAHIYCMNAHSKHNFIDESCTIWTTRKLSKKEVGNK